MRFAGNLPKDKVSVWHSNDAKECRVGVDLSIKWDLLMIAIPPPPHPICLGELIKEGIQEGSFDWWQPHHPCPWAVALLGRTRQCHCQSYTHAHQSTLNQLIVNSGVEFAARTFGVYEGCLQRIRTVEELLQVMDRGTIRRILQWEWRGMEGWSPRVCNSHCCQFNEAESDIDGQDDHPLWLPVASSTMMIQPTAEGWRSMMSDAACEISPFLYHVLWLFFPIFQGCAVYVTRLFSVQDVDYFWKHSASED